MSPFVGLIEERSAIPKPQNAVNGQTDKLARVLAYKPEGFLFVELDERKLAELHYLFVEQGIVVGMFAGPPHAVAEMIVAERELEPVIVAKEDGMPESHGVSN
jgi:hypothetical protein